MQLVGARRLLHSGTVPELEGVKAKHLSLSCALSTTAKQASGKRKKRGLRRLKAGCGACVKLRAPWKRKKKKAPVEEDVKHYMETGY